MGLETGTLIPDLVEANPGGSDPKSEGDDHLRLIKTCVRGSFANFVGTTADPKFVALTEDEINDAALQGDVSNITANWLFSADVTLANNVALAGLDTAVAQKNLLHIDLTDVVQWGDASLNASHKALAKETFIIGGVVSADIVDAATGGLLVADIDAVAKKAGFRNPTAIAAGASRDLAQSDEGRILTCSTVAAVYTAIVLEEFTVLRLMAFTDITLLPSGITINVLDGGGSPVPAAAGVGIINNSVVEVVYKSATEIEIFGNGITVL